MAEIFSFTPSPSHRPNHGSRGGPRPLPRWGEGQKVTSPSRGEVGAQHRVRVEWHSGEAHEGIPFGTVPMDPPVKPEDGVLVLNGAFNKKPAIVRFNRTIHEVPAPRAVLSAMRMKNRKPLLFIHNLKPHRKTGK